MTTFTFSLQQGASGIDTEETTVLSKVENHSDRAVSHLLSKNKPRIEAFLRAFVDQIQSLEDLAWDVLTKSWTIEVDGNGPAEGAQLDIIGEIVGQPRNDQNDETYLKFIKAKIVVNSSDGKTETLFQLLKEIGYENAIGSYEFYPAHLALYTDESPFPIEANMMAQLAKSAGVRFTLLYSSYDSSNLFKMSSQNDNDETDNGICYGSVYQPTFGGRLSGAAE